MGIESIAVVNKPISPSNGTLTERMGFDRYDGAQTMIDVPQSGKLIQNHNKTPLKDDFSDSDKEDMADNELSLDSSKRAKTSSKKVTGRSPSTTENA